MVRDTTEITAEWIRRNQAYWQSVGFEWSTELHKALSEAGDPISKETVLNLQRAGKVKVNSKAWRPRFVCMVKLKQTAGGRAYLCGALGLENPYPDLTDHLEPEIIETVWDNFRKHVCEELNQDRETFWALRPCEVIQSLATVAENGELVRSWKLLIPELSEQTSMLAAWKATWQAPLAIQAIRASLLAKMQADSEPETYLAAIENKALCGCLESALKNPSVVISSAVAKVAKDLRKELDLAS